jgi:hypothetical protein
MVSNAAAYIGNVWCGDKPTSPEVRTEIVYDCTLPVGIKARVFRDGIFAFDFSE